MAKSGTLGCWQQLSTSHKLLQSSWRVHTCYTCTSVSGMIFLLSHSCSMWQSRPAHFAQKSEPQLGHTRSP